MMKSIRTFDVKKSKSKAFVLMITFDEKHMFNGPKMIRPAVFKLIIKDDERRSTFLHSNSIFITMIQIHTFEHLCPDINLEQ